MDSTRKNYITDSEGYVWRERTDHNFDNSTKSASTQYYVDGSGYKVFTKDKGDSGVINVLVNSNNPGESRIYSIEDVVNDKYYYYDENGARLSEDIVNKKLKDIDDSINDAYF